MKTFAGLTKAQDRVFAQICLGNDIGHNQKVLQALEEKGMIIKKKETLPGYPPVTIDRWDFVLRWHIVWCEWCSKNIKEEK